MEDWADLVDEQVVRSRIAAAEAGRHWNDVQVLYTSEWCAAVKRIRSGHPTAVEAGILFLELDPWCRFSGYEKERLYRLLARAPLTPTQSDRLRAVVLRRLADRRGRDRSTLRALARLANAVWTPSFQRRIDHLPRSTDPTLAAHEQAFLTSARHGHLGSIRWGIDHGDEPPRRRKKPKSTRRPPRSDGGP